MVSCGGCSWGDLCLKSPVELMGEIERGTLERSLLAAVRVGLD